MPCNPNIDRREFCLLAGSTIVATALSSSCGGIGASAFAREGRLTARPREGVQSTATGPIELHLDNGREAIFYLPKRASQSPVPLLLMLHGATQNAQDMFDYLGTAPEEAGVAVLAPKSRETTWDAIGGSFGEDVDLLNAALERVFATTAIDPARVAIGGFSDGASYAISLGIINGDLFRSVAAFSPGFVISGMPHGKPRIFISHGTQDHILPIDSCGRRVAAGLIARGYDVTFREFEGDHEIPAAVAREGMMWVAGLAHGLEGRRSGEGNGKLIDLKI
ncbi:MAG TPA: PHB depolymerase family esterase [Pyrinomonadaceae bacterium]|jgi:predicted esterase